MDLRGSRVCFSYFEVFCDKRHMLIVLSWICNSEVGLANEVPITNISSLETYIYDDNAMLLIVDGYQILSGSFPINVLVVLRLINFLRKIFVTM